MIVYLKKVGVKQCSPDELTDFIERILINIFSELKISFSISVNFSPTRVISSVIS